MTVAKWRLSRCNRIALHVELPAVDEVPKYEELRQRVSTSRGDQTRSRDRSRQECRTFPVTPEQTSTDQSVCHFPAAPCSQHNVASRVVLGYRMLGADFASAIGAK